jgi:hypothetical protein
VIDRIQTVVCETDNVVCGLTRIAPQHAFHKKHVALIRCYWQIENGLHDSRDITLKEKSTRLTAGNAG